MLINPVDAALVPDVDAYQDDDPIPGRRAGSGAVTAALRAGDIGGEPSGQRLSTWGKCPMCWRLPTCTMPSWT